MEKSSLSKTRKPLNLNVQTSNIRQKIGLDQNKPDIQSAYINKTQLKASHQKVSSKDNSPLYSNHMSKLGDNSPLKTPKSVYLKQNSTKLKINGIQMKDLNQITILGSGAFGEVSLVTIRSDQDQKLYALKKQSKVEIYNNDAIDYLKQEKKIMQECSHPNINQFKYYFHDKYFAYMLVEFCSGGEVHQRLSQEGPLKNKDVKFYAAEILNVLQYLHQKSIIYRDLKPENLMLDENGHIKIIDFGLAKKLDKTGRTYTLCGTPEYLAPEQIQLKSQQGYGMNVDWWAYGNLIYELLARRTAFQADNPFGVYQKIQEGIKSWPADIDSDAKDLIQQLLQIEPEKRIGYKDDGESIKKHPWFKDINFNTIHEQEAPFIPSSQDVQNLKLFNTTQVSNIKLQEFPQEYNNLFDF